MSNNATKSRIAATFERLKSSGRKGLIPYITSGHPNPTITIELMHAIVAAGADVLELGVPFSDPMADGPTIQRSNELALTFGVGLKDVLGYVQEFRSKDNITPIVLMGYANPIERMGTQAFVERAAKAGVDGVLVVDYPPEEALDFSALLRQYGLDPIFLLAPTSADARITNVAQQASGYIYYVSLNGITGSASPDLVEVKARVAHVKASTGLPIGVGFGIKDGETARAIAEWSDAVVIGSKLIQEIEAGPVESAVARASAFVASIRSAMDRP
jgi:tryptophan synthase alpha chain